MPCCQKTQLRSLMRGRARPDLGELIIDIPFVGEMVVAESPASGELPLPGGQVPPVEGTTPGAVPVRPGQWDERVSPARYTIASGDTFVGLATTYMGSGGRWKEIYDFQSSAFRTKRPNPSVIGVGDVIEMPPDAQATFLAATACPGEGPFTVPNGKAFPLPPGVALPPCVTRPGAPPGTRGPGLGKFAPFLIAAGVAATAGVVIYAATRPPRRRRSNPCWY